MNDPWLGMASAITPVTQGESGLYYKREDAFAPLGYGGINGSKLRQLVYLMRPMQNGPGVVTACSVLSPQSSMTALVGQHFQIPVTVIFGATHRFSALKHENPKIAESAGARFEFIRVAYNPALQRACKSYSERHGLDVVPYGITTPEGATAQQVADFHAVAAPQVQNIPTEVRTLILPFGSGNSVAGILTGLAKYGYGSVNQIVLVGIGPSRLVWLWKRLAQIEEATGLSIRSLFSLEAHDGPDILGAAEGGPIAMDHFDLHGTGYVTYSDRIPWHEDGIDFHPTYEGKIMKWLREPSLAHREAVFSLVEHRDSTLFWIVGSEPHLSAMVLS